MSFVNGKAILLYTILKQCNLQFNLLKMLSYEIKFLNASVSSKVATIKKGEKIIGSQPIYLISPVKPEPNIFFAWLNYILVKCMLTNLLINILIF